MVSLANALCEYVRKNPYLSLVQCYARDDERVEEGILVPLRIQGTLAVGQIVPMAKFRHHFSIPIDGVEIDPFHFLQTFVITAPTKNTVKIFHFLDLQSAHFVPHPQGGS